MEKKEIVRAIKYSSIAWLTGILELMLVAIFNMLHINNMVSYFIALVITVILNFLINRKYTFKSSNNISRAMLLLLLFYLVFTPLSLLFVAYLGDGIVLDKNLLIIKSLNWHWSIGFLINVTINIFLEYMFQKYVIFKNSLDSNKLVNKEK